MPGNEQLGANQPVPNPNQEPTKGPDPEAGAPEGDLLDAAAEGNYDLGAEAQAFLADAPASTESTGREVPIAEEGAPEGAQAEGAEPFMEGAPDPAPDSGQSRLMGALKTAGSAVAEGARWAAPVVGTALKEETGVDLYKFSAEQPELDRDQNFAAGVTRWAIRRGLERLAESQAA